jgi:TIR domain
MSDHVFVSYARQDEGFVLRLATDLKARGIAVWLDQWAITPGADWDQCIDRALAESFQVVAILSPAAVASKQVRAEIQLAVDAPSKTVYPVLYQDCEVPRVLRLYQFLDFRDTRNYGRELERLARALEGETEPSKLATPSPSPTPRRPDEGKARGRRLILAAIVATIVVGGGGILLYRVDEALLNACQKGDSQACAILKGSSPANPATNEDSTNPTEFRQSQPPDQPSLRAQAPKIVWLGGFKFKEDENLNGFLVGSSGDWLVLSNHDDPDALGYTTDATVYKSPRSISVTVTTDVKPDEVESSERVLSTIIQVPLLMRADLLQYCSLGMAR